jgi:hypothetical protein
MTGRKKIHVICFSRSINAFSNFQPLTSPLPCGMGVPLHFPGGGRQKAFFGG